jgi:cytochrome c oxidase subunit 2
MIGWVYAMEPKDYENWLSGGSGEGTMAQSGKKLFESLACNNCHKEDNTGRCPNLLGVFGQNVKLVGGANVKADEAYIRESILNPQAKVVAGYEPVMPTFQGLVTEDQVVQLIEYVRSLGPKPAVGAAPTSPAPAETKASPGVVPAKR